MRPGYLDIWNRIFSFPSLGWIWNQLYLNMSGMLGSLVYAAAKSLQLCPTLCDPIDSSPPGSPVPGILQARTLEWVAISFNAWKWRVKVKSLSHVRLLVTPWTAAHQAPPSMGFSRQEYWSRVPLPSPNLVYGKPNFSWGPRFQEHLFFFEWVTLSRMHVLYPCEVLLNDI